MKLKLFIWILTSTQLVEGNKSGSILADDGIVADERNLRGQQGMNHGGGGGFHGGQNHGGQGGYGQGHAHGDDGYGGRQAEMNAIHNLVSYRNDINRSVVIDEDSGAHQLETFSKSNDPVVAGWIQMHVRQMLNLINTNQLSFG